MAEEINERITVGAIFDKTPLIKPVWFIWRKREYRLKKITYAWIDNEGREKRYHFSATDGGNLYELCYYSEKLTWQLESLS